MRLATSTINRWLTFPAGALLLSDIDRGHAHATTPPQRALAGEEINAYSAAQALSQVILNPVYEYVAHARATDEDDESSWSWKTKAAEDELTYVAMDPIYVESFVTFDLSYSSVDNVETFLSGATLKLYSLNGYPNNTVFDIILPDETVNDDADDDDDAYFDDDADEVDSDWDQSSDVDVSRCVDSNPCWVDVDVTDGLLRSIVEQDSLAITFGIRVEQEPIRGAFASRNYKGERFSPQLILEFGTDLDLIATDLTRSGHLKGSGRQFDKKKKNKKNKKGNGGSRRSDKKKKPGKNKKKGKKPGKNNGGMHFSAIGIANEKPNKKDKPNEKDKPNKKGTPNKKDTPKNQQEYISPDGNRPGNNDKPNGNKPGKNKPANNRPSGDKPAKTKPNAGAPSDSMQDSSKTNDKPNASKPANDKPGGDTSNTANNSSSNTNNAGTSSANEVLRILSTKESAIDNKLFLYESPAGGWVPSSIYKYDGLAKGLEIMNGKGVNDMYFFLGGDDENEYKYGLANVAAFLAQSMKETIKYDACDEVSISSFFVTSRCSFI